MIFFAGPGRCLIPETKEEFDGSPLIEVLHGDCNKEIAKIGPLPPASLGVAFIDPTGISPLAFETIRKLTAKRKIDLIINFHEGMGVSHEFTSMHHDRRKRFWNKIILIDPHGQRKFLGF